MNTYTVKLTNTQGEKIKSLLEGKGAEFDVIQYSFWRAKTKDFQATLYTSGKFLIQGKDITHFSSEIEKYLGISSQVAVSKSISKNQSTQNTTPPDIYIGTDESGKGDFFGPLVIAGVQVSSSNKKLFVELGIKDSKQLDDAKIKKLAAHIRNNSVHSVVTMMPAKYNELYVKFKNLNKLLAWGHARVIENILEKNPCAYALSDQFGDERLIKNALMEKGKQITLDQRHKAESDIAVAAASIIARAEFVKRMEEMSSKYKIIFPKGASSKVIEQGKLFLTKNTKDELKNVAKIHFKTYLELTK